MSSSSSSSSSRPVKLRFYNLDIGLIFSCVLHVGTPAYTGLHLHSFAEHRVKQLKYFTNPRRLGMFRFV